MWSRPNAPDLNGTEPQLTGRSGFLSSGQRVAIIILAAVARSGGSRGLVSARGILQIRNLQMTASACSAAR